jgi:hypothetical protein
VVVNDKFEEDVEISCLALFQGTTPGCLKGLRETMKNLNRYAG